MSDRTKSVKERQCFSPPSSLPRGWRKREIVQALGFRLRFCLTIASAVLSTFDTKPDRAASSNGFNIVIRPLDFTGTTNAPGSGGSMTTTDFFGLGGMHLIRPQKRPPQHS